jgi:acyl carrier protein
VISKGVISKEEVSEKIFALLGKLANDWEYDGEIGLETYLFSELGLQSLDVVIFGNTIQQEYGQPIPFSDLLEEIGRRDLNDTQLSEWIDFTYDHLAAKDVTAGQVGERNDS